MKKWILLIIMVLCFAGCGNTGNENVQEENSTTETIIPTVTSTVTSEATEVVNEDVVETLISTEEVKEDEVEVTVTLTEEISEEIVNEDIIFVNDTKDRIGRGRYDSLDNVNTYKLNAEFVAPYYVGRNDETATNFLKNNKGVNDDWLYLGMPMYLPEKLSGRVAYVSIGDTDVAKIENNELIGLKQGSFILTTYDENMNILEEKNFFCTTFNDSKSNIESFVSFDGNLSDYSNARDFEYWKTSVKTIQDMVWMLEARNFVYDFNKEPEFGYMWNTGSSYNTWTWTPSAETIFEMSGGVCIQVAQLAIAMLANDFEDWGAVLVEGNQGHIFNWFYEDGYYYVFDFTQVISDNYNHFSNINFRSYAKYVKKFSSIEEIKQYCISEKVSLQHNYAIYMYSCKGYDFLPCNVNTGMSDSNGCLNGTFMDGDKDYITIRFQDIVMEDLVVLWENPKSTKIVWESVQLKDVSSDIPYVYGRNELSFRYNY